MDQNIKIDDVHSYIIKHIKENFTDIVSGSAYPQKKSGFYLQDIVRSFLGHKRGDALNQNVQVERLFLDAAWELSCRGIIRPGPIKMTYENETSLVCYSLTLHGEKWIQNSGIEPFIFTSYERYVALIAPYSDKFDKGFLIRVTEAAKCYQYGCYYASCTMVGAAAESILLSLASKKMGSIEEAKKIYHNRSGRSEIIKKIKENEKDSIKTELDDYIKILSHWRDEGGHGDNRIVISEWEAWEGLSRLLRFVNFAFNKISV